MFNHRFILAILLFSTYSISSHSESSYSEGEPGFDEICRVYTEAYNSNMSINVLSEYIFNNIKKRVSFDEALEAHEAVMHADAKSRYVLFKGSAEYTLKRSWACKAMKAIMAMQVR